MQPAQGIRFIHAAICTEVRQIEDQAAAAETAEQLAALAQRVAFFAKIVTHHTEGEELGLYAELDQRVRHVGAAYLHDHREERALFADIATKIEAARHHPTAKAFAQVRRQTIALTEHLVPHVHKEDELVTPLLCELFSPAEQGAHIAKMMGTFPPELLAQALPWLIAQIGADDRIAYLNMVKVVMPPERLAVACGWIRNGVAADVWSGICAHVPGLPG